MKAKPVVRRERADHDVESIIDHYCLGVGAERAALGFLDALDHAFAHIGLNPMTGSPRYAHALNLPGLRCWPLTRYPHLVFYIERDQRIDVWRVLHGQRDLPACRAPMPRPTDRLTDA